MSVLQLHHQARHYVQRVPHRCFYCQGPLRHGACTETCNALVRLQKRHDVPTGLFGTAPGYRERTNA